MTSSSTFACRACDAPLEHSFIDLGMSPLANSFIPMDRSDEVEVFYPLHVKACSACYLAQLDEFEPPEHIFSDTYPYLSSFSDSWLRHSKAYSDAMIQRFGLCTSAHIAEVASNDGYLLKWFLERGFTVTGIEPARNCAALAEERGITTEIEFFGVESARQIAARRGTADLMVANNVLAHVPNLKDFVGGFNEMLAAEGVATFEFPHLLNLVRCTQFDTIYHEHFSYLALGPVLKVLEGAGLRVFDVERLPTHGGSLRVFVCHEDAKHELRNSVGTLRHEEIAAGLENLATYAGFKEKVIEIKEHTLAFLFEARRAGKTVCGYGAPAKGNTFLNYCGIGPDHLAFTVDRNPAKQNTLLPGTRIPVQAVGAIDAGKPDYILILPWNLKDEIIKDMAHVREWGGQFVTCIPELSIL